jgi:glutamate-5-semialdehyde dehydrogenase
MNMSDEREAVLEAARAARIAAADLAVCTRAQKDAALNAMADALVTHAGIIIEANSRDIAAATAAGTDAAIIDRLTLNNERVHAVADALRTVADLPDPVGEVVRGYTLPNGLEVRQLRVPMGVIAMIYEARPNVTVDAAGLSLKSGNCVLLRGSSSAHNTNTELVAVMRNALADTDVPVDAIQLAPGTTHEAAKHLMTARGLVDVVIPRGGAGLIETVVTQSTVPVIETGVGNCHVYVDEAADLKMAIDIVINSKTQRTSVCNTAETVLVHRAIADEFLPMLMTAFKDAGVTVHGDVSMANAAAEVGTKFATVTDADWAAEYYSLDMAAGVVDSIDDAIAHIRRWSSGHTEAIVSNSQSAIRRFTSGLDSAAIMVNASTRFTDGGEFGFGAEIGISTQKLHARGPMGLQELTTTTYIVTGNGHTRH